MPIGRDGVRFRGKTGSHRRRAKPARLTQSGQSGRSSCTIIPERSDTVARGYRDDEAGRRGGKAARPMSKSTSLLSVPFLGRCKRSPNLARGLDESLRGGAERAILQGHYSVWQAGDGEF